MRKIVSAGYVLIEKWECAFDEECANNLEYRLFIKEHPIARASELDPREAFFGGRTGNIVTYYEAREGQKIRYVDVCSLYPISVKQGLFP